MATRAAMIYVDGRTLEAAACYERVIQLNSAFAYTNLGNALGAEGSHGDEELCYRRAIEFNPTLCSGPCKPRGNTLKKQGRLSEARACYQQAIEIKPDFAEAFCNLRKACQI